MEVEMTSVKWMESFCCRHLDDSTPWQGECPFCRAERAEAQCKAMAEVVAAAGSESLTHMPMLTDNRVPCPCALCCALAALEER